MEYNKEYPSTVCFTELDQGSDVLGKLSLPKSMKHTVEVIDCEIGHFIQLNAYPQRGRWSIIGMFNMFSALRSVFFLLT